MPSSDHRPAAATATATDPKDNGSDSEEHEEIEEEVEMEEEMEEEVHEEQDIRKGLSDAPIHENRNNASQGMESLGHEEQLSSVSSALDKSVENLPSDTLAVEDSKRNSNLSCTSEKREKEESCINSEDSKFPKIGESPVASDDNVFQATTADKNGSGAILEKGILKDDNNAHYDCKAHLCNSEIMTDDTTKRCSVFGEEVVPTISTKDIFDEEDSGVIYSKEEIKQMGMQSVEEMKQKESRLATTHIRLRSLSPGADFRDRNKQPAVICDFFAKGWCIKGNSCRFLHIKDRADSAGRVPERNVVDANKKSELWAGEGLFSVPPFRGKSLFPEQRYFSSSSVMLNTDRNTMIPAYAISLEELASKRGQYMLNARSSPDLSRSLNLSSSTSLPSSTSMLPSPHCSAYTRPSLSFSSSSKSASLLRSSSPFSGSETENLSVHNASGEPLCYGGHKEKNIFYDWEPSVPFRPSFFINSLNMSSPGSQYDPIHDSIEQPNLGDRFSKILSSSSQGTSILSSHLPINGDPVLTGTLCQEYSSGKYSHHKFLENMLDNNSYGKSVFTTEAETVGAEQHNGIALPREEKLLGSAYVKDVTKANKHNIDLELQSDGPRHNKKSKVDLSEANSEQDQKALKLFRDSLIDFVKELLKPTWEEGRLSRDAHKMIVKKAVDKVISTVQPNQIPSTMEKVYLYFSLSDTKIAKLVEGYLEKYGKF